MAIKKQQNKRPLDEAQTAPAQNGADIKKSQKASKKPKLEKPIPAQNGVPSKKPQKSEKSQVKIVKVEEIKPKAKAPSAVSLDPKAEAKRLKNAAKLAKKKENRQEARKEVGQYKPEMVKLSEEQINLKINAINSRPSLSKTAKRKLAVLKKRLQIIKGTYVPKPRPETSDLSKSERKHRRAALRKERKAAADAEKKNVSEESTKVVAKPAESKKQKAVVAAAQPAKKEKLAKAGKQQAKKLIVKKEEPEESEDEDEEEESDEAVDTSAASFMNTTAEESEDEEEDDDDEEEEAEIGSPVKRVKQEPKKEKQEIEKKPFVKKENAKTVAANGDSQDGKKKRFVLFVGNLSFESSADDIKKHFLTKVDNVADVRVPLRPGTTSPRGFAYVEVSNPTDYEKALSLHGTNLNGRRLKVEYTQGGSKSTGNRSEVISKNKKLHAMRKQGMLAGSRKEGNNRNDRRQKAKQHGGA